jgi:DNA-binding Lrp family transcriptional regulator
MSISAYILIRATPGKVPEVLEQVRTIPNTRRAHMVTGNHDIIALLQAPSTEELGGAITHNIYGSSHIASSETSLVVS